MAETPSAMPELGTPLPKFSLPSVMGGVCDETSSMGRSGLLVAFVCNHCPYVIRIGRKLVRLANYWIEQDLGVVMISSNDAEAYPQDGPEQMLELARDLEFRFHYLYDESQDVARAFQAECTPDFFLYDKNGKLAYRGQFDGARPNNDVLATGQDLSRAVECVLQGKQPDPNQIPSVGCNIKWK